MGIIRIFNKGDGKTVQPATSTKPAPSVVHRRRRWYGVWDGKIAPQLRPGEAEAQYARADAERAHERAQLQADLEADAARRKAGISPPDPPRTSQSILNRKF
jgi:hypothetical protein